MRHAVRKSQQMRKAPTPEQTAVKVVTVSTALAAALMASTAQQTVNLGHMQTRSRDLLTGEKTTIICAMHFRSKSQSPLLHVPIADLFAAHVVMWVRLQRSA